jgi:CDP-paratose 2-epimerase
MSRWLITGGAGFIGANTVLKLLALGEEVVVLDDLSRNGSLQNAQLLQAAGLRSLVTVSVADTDAYELWASNEEAFDVILHLAAQVSLMESLSNPRLDFEVNALGTLNVLESVRLFWPRARVIFASTNKVYGDLSSRLVTETESRFVLGDCPNGIFETEPLDFHGGYSCSKGSADQYCLDYHRIFNIDSVVLRQSAICGQLQNPRADQGWASFMVRETLSKREIHLNGRGKQVRDLLDVEDLVNLYLIIAKHDTFKHRVFNVGGGPGRDISLLEFFSELENRGFSPQYQFGMERPSDQKVFIANLQAITDETGWSPVFSKENIIDRLIETELLNLNSSKFGAEHG